MDTSPRSRKDDYFETVLAKIDFVLGEVDQVVALGDVFHRPTISLWSMHRLMKVIKKHGKPFYSITGNHDIYNLNMESFPRTALSLLNEAGILKIVDHFLVGPVLFETIPMGPIPVVSKATSNNSVLLGHCFYESELDRRFSITANDLRGKGYKMVLLGHDHEPHPPEKVDETVVMRWGSLGRHTSHAYNLNRQPEFLSLGIGPSGITSVELVEVKCPLATEVFHPEAFQKKNSNALSFTMNVQELLDSFQKSSAATRMSIRMALEELKSPPLVSEYLKSLYERNALAFG